jgi:hypothetical protein
MSGKDKTVNTEAQRNARKAKAISAFDFPCASMVDGFGSSWFATGVFRFIDVSCQFSPKEAIFSRPPRGFVAGHGGIIPLPGAHVRRSRHGGTWVTNAKNLKYQ